MARHLRSLTDLSKEVLAEADQASRVKNAERQIVKVASAQPAFSTDLGLGLHKIAAALREHEDEVTYEDLNQFMAGAR